MHLRAHSCFNHYQTFQVYNTKKSVDMSARHGRGGDKNSFVRKEGASQKKIGKH